MISYIFLLWGHAILHDNALIRLRHKSSNMFSPVQLVLGFEPDIMHLRTFNYIVQVPIAPPLRTKMGLQCKVGIYIHFSSPSVIKYLEPITCDLFIAKFADCLFDETVFPTLRNIKVKLVEDISMNVGTLNHLNLHTL